MARTILVAVVASLAFSVAAQQVDSPLVAAAKRTNRLAKAPARVITNENLVTFGGRISEASSTAQPATAAAANVSDPAASSDWAALEAVAAARRAAQAQQTTQPPPQIEGSSRASYSVRPSSVTNATMGSSASASRRDSSVRSVERDAPGRSVSYDQTAPSSSRDAAAPTRRD